jgi:hypothetical protein
VPFESDIGSCRPRASSKFDINTFPPRTTPKKLNINTINRHEKRVLLDNFMSRSGEMEESDEQGQPARSSTINVKDKTSVVF